MQTTWATVHGTADDGDVSIGDANLVDGNDVVYVLAGDNLVTVQGQNGEVVWDNTYHDFAGKHLESAWRRFGLFRTGDPVAYYGGYRWMLPGQAKIGEPKGGIVAFTAK